MINAIVMFHILVVLNTSDLNCNSSRNDTHSSINVHGNFDFDLITEDYVFDQICNFQNNKSPGLDNFHARLLKLAAPVICHSLAYICNLSLITGTFPTEWKLAKVTPIYKDGCKSDVGNYRPISVLNIISKIIERAVHDQLYDFLIKCNILNPAQSGFRSNHSTHSTLLDVSDYILQNMNEGRATAAIFLDLRKAFDTINHQILFSKLHDYGIKNNTLKWFVSYLSNRAQRVNVNSTLSDFKCINIGIPQGSILGPLLFIIYVNSLPNSVSCKCVMYADDTTLLCSSSDPIVLQQELNNNMYSRGDRGESAPEASPPTTCF